MGNLSGRNEPEDAGSQTPPGMGMNGSAAHMDSPRDGAGQGMESSGYAPMEVVPPGGGGPPQASGDEDPVDVLERLFGDRGGVPMVFRWEGGGEEVYLTGTFNNWSARIPMQKANNEDDFVLIQELSRGRHAYKFIVDGEWRFASEEQQVVDRSGNVNNFIDLTDFQPRFEELTETRWQQKDLEKEVYNHAIPEINDYTQEPPIMPPHLRHVPLNKKSGAHLPVTLDHLYCTARQNGITVLGMSARVRQKFVTSVYYTPVTGGFPLVQRRPTTSSASNAPTSSPNMASPTTSSMSNTMGRIGE